MLLNKGMFDKAVAVCKEHCPRILSDVLARVEGGTPAPQRREPAAPFVPGQPAVYCSESSEDLIKTAKLLEEQGEAWRPSC